MKKYMKIYNIINIISHVETFKQRLLRRAPTITNRCALTYAFFGEEYNEL